MENYDEIRNEFNIEIKRNENRKNNTQWRKDEWKGNKKEEWRWIKFKE